jgi:large subunit ribosomal protein L10Ae
LEIKKRNFVETIELQVGLRNFDPSRDKRFAGTVRLPYVPRPQLKICVIADEQHAAECTKHEVPFVTSSDIKKLNKNKKAVMQLVKKFDAFLASESLLKILPRYAGPWFTKANKFPALLTHNDNLLTKIEEIKGTIKFQMKKVLCMHVAIGNVNMRKEELLRNLIMAVNTLVGLLKKNWQNVKAIYIKSTMGPPFKLF